LFKKIVGEIELVSPQKLEEQCVAFFIWAVFMQGRYKTSCVTSEDRIRTKK
jgi:hypothetical protein